MAWLAPSWSGSSSALLLLAGFRALLAPLLAVLELYYSFWHKAWLLVLIGVLPILAGEEGQWGQGLNVMLWTLLPFVLNHTFSLKTPTASRVETITYLFWLSDQVPTLQIPAGSFLYLSSFSPHPIQPTGLMQNCTFSASEDDPSIYTVYCILFTVYCRQSGLATINTGGQKGPRASRPFAAFREY